jgi:PrcB C-terminal
MGEGANYTAKAAAARTHPASPNSVPFQTVAKGFRSGISEPLQTVARNDAEWQTLWQKQVAVQSNPLPPPAIDFKNELVAAVFLGEKPTGGYSIEIVGAEKTNGSLTISYSETMPRSGSMLTQAFTQPFHIVRVITTDAENVAFRRLP